MASREFMRPIQDTRYIMERFPVIQVSTIEELAEYIKEMPSSVIGIFSGKAAAGGSLTGTSKSATIIAKYIESGNYADYFCLVGDASSGKAAIGSFSTVSPYTVTQFWATS